MSISIQVPVSPHISKYVKKKFGRQVVISDRNVLAGLIMKSPRRTTEDMSLIEVQIDANISQLLTIKSLWTFFDNLFIHDLVSYVKHRTDIEEALAKKSILDFLNYYDINELEYPYSRAVWHWKQYKKEQSRSDAVC